MRVRLVFLFALVSTLSVAQAPAEAGVSPGEKAIGILFSLKDMLPAGAQTHAEVTAQKAAVLAKLAELEALGPAVVKELEKIPKQEENAEEAKVLVELFRNTAKLYAKDAADANFSGYAAGPLNRVLDDVIQERFARWYAAPGAWGKEKAQKLAKGINPFPQLPAKLLAIKKAIRESSLPKAEREGIETLVQRFEEELVAGGCLPELNAKKKGPHE